jgi:FkbM family methyltransferase
MFPTRILKKVLFRAFTKDLRLQKAWGMLHTLALYGMNYGGGGAIEASGEEWVLSRVVSPRCKTDDAVIFDVGANVGKYSLLTARYIPKGKIHAFEPSGRTYDDLAQNIKEAGAGGRVIPHRLGFSSASGTVTLHSYTADGVRASPLSSIDLRRPTQVVDVKRESSEQIQVKTIDAFCEENRIAHIDFLKLDVEGHELDVLQGANSMLSGSNISIIQFEFGPPNLYSKTYFFDFWAMLSGRYEIYRIIPKGIVRIDCYGEHREVFLTTNYLAVLRADPLLW